MYSSLTRTEESRVIHSIEVSTKPIFSYRDDFLAAFQAVFEANRYVWLTLKVYRNAEAYRVDKVLIYDLKEFRKRTASTENEGNLSKTGNCGDVQKQESESHHTCI